MLIVNIGLLKLLLSNAHLVQQCKKLIMLFYCSVIFYTVKYRKLTKNVYAIMKKLLLQLHQFQFETGKMSQD